MKKIIILLVLLLIPNNIYAINTSASTYAVMDMNTNRVLLGKNIHESRLIASISKIMTCIIAIESNKLDEIVTVDDSIAKSYGSGIYIQVGEKLTLRDLLYGLMLRSGNDAALMISNYISKSEENFVKKMNEKAKILNMNDTTFVNSSGLDDKGGNYSSAYDMGILTSYAMKNSEYMKIVSTKKYKLKTNYKTYIWNNKNKLLNVKYITGGKTGFTEKAKRTLVTTAYKDNLSLVIVTLNDSNDWNDHIKLYEYIFDNYHGYKVLNKDNYEVLNEKYYNNLYIKNDRYIALSNDEIKNIINNIKILKLKKYKSGDKVGENNIYLGDELILTEPIYVKKEVAKAKKENIFKKIFKFLK